MFRGTSGNENLHHGQFATASQRETRHSGNDWLSDGSELCPVAQEVGLVCVCILLVLHLLDVCTRRKSFLGAGQNDGTDRRIIVGILGRLVQLVEERRVQCVERFGSVECDQFDACSGRGYENVLVVLALRG